MSRILSVLAGVAIAVFGALVAGEYDYGGIVAPLTGLVLGTLVSEAVALGGQWRGRVPATIAAVVAATGVAWGGWIASGSGVAPFPWLAWPGAILAAGVAAVRTRPRAMRRRRSSAPS